MSNIDPIRVAFEEFVSEEYRLSIDDLRSGNGYCGLQDEFGLSNIFAAFKAGREPMRDEIINEFAVFSDTLWLKKAIKEMK